MLELGLIVCRAWTRCTSPLACIEDTPAATERSVNAVIRMHGQRSPSNA